MSAEDLTDINKILAGMNTHLPAVRKTLIDLAESERPSYRTRSGEIIDIERSEIDFMMERCSEMDKIRLKLPILITTDITGDIPAWRVDGAAESKFVAELLGKPQFRQDSLRFYNPEYQKIRKILPTAAIIVYLP